MVQKAQCVNTLDAEVVEVPLGGVEGIGVAPQGW